MAEYKQLELFDLGSYTKQEADIVQPIVQTKPESEQIILDFKLKVDLSSTPHLKVLFEPKLAA